MNMATTTTVTAATTPPQPPQPPPPPALHRQQQRGHRHHQQQHPHLPAGRHNGVEVFGRVQVRDVSSVQYVVNVLQHHFVHDLHVAVAHRCYFVFPMDEHRKSTANSGDGRLHAKCVQRIIARCQCNNTDGTHMGVIDWFVKSEREPSTVVKNSITPFHGDGSEVWGKYQNSNGSTV